MPLPCNLHPQLRLGQYNQPKKEIYQLEKKLIVVSPLVPRHPIVVKQITKIIYSRQTWRSLPCHDLRSLDNGTVSMVNLQNFQAIEK
jgi:hypothetical protein